ncbi:hypothetical protein BDN72DRAFT_831533 [Pluteus cervinus]|uniref:Uncharacterized protein n=1 Tax=Pluteus cervinus TaxID=181527 RepID=A0ACD3BGE4_9AGAR|nr:hypothetical protein BDN72DRAFT_831533 [Pluteus cervinus]
MAARKIVNLLAVTSLALLASTFSATPANALSLESHAVRHAHRSHANILLNKKRTSGNSGRCKIRPSSSPVASPAETSQGNQGGDNGQNSGGNNNNNDGSATSPPPPPPPSASPPPPPPPPPSGGGRGKAGLAWPQDDDNALRNMVGPKISTIYTWSPWLPDITQQLGLQGAIMLWGDKQISDFVNNAKPGYGQYAMGPNEPNQDGQSTMDPGHAADLWRQYIDPLQYQGYGLVSPACTNAPSGIDWQHQFLAACSGCRVDFMAFHFYDKDPQAMITYMQQFYGEFNGRPLWATEFACQNFAGDDQCSTGDVWNFMQTVTGWMDSSPTVDRYFAFGAMYDMYNVNPDNQLLGGNGAPTDLGYYYINNS